MKVLRERFVGTCYIPLCFCLNCLKGFSSWCSLPGVYHQNLVVQHPHTYMQASVTRKTNLSQHQKGRFRSVPDDTMAIKCGRTVSQNHNYTGCWSPWTLVYKLIWPLCFYLLCRAWLRACKRTHSWAHQLHWWWKKGAASIIQVGKNCRLHLCDNFDYFIAWPGRALPGAIYQYTFKFIMGRMSVLPHCCEGSYESEWTQFFLFKNSMVFSLEMAKVQYIAKSDDNNLSWISAIHQCSCISIII